MKKLNKKIIVAVMAVLPLSGVALSDGGAFDRIVSEVVSNNPELKSKRARLNGSEFADMAESRLNAPDLDFEHQWGQYGIGNKWSVGISQSFDWPGLYKARSSANKKSSASYNAAYAGDVFDVTLAVRRLLVDIISVKYRKSIMSRQLENLATISLNTRKAFDRGEATILEMNKLRLQQFSAESALESLDADYAALLAQLSALNGGSVPDVTMLTEYPDMALLPEEKYLDMMETNDLRLVALRTDIDSKYALAGVENLKRYPGFTIGYVHNVELGEHFNGLRVGINLPVFSGSYRHKAAISQAQALEYDYESYKAARQSEIVADYSSAIKLKKRIDGHDGFFTGDSYISTLRKAFDGGQMALLEYLYEVDSYIGACMDYVDAVARYNKLLMNLNRYNIN